MVENGSNFVVPSEHFLLAFVLVLKYGTFLAAFDLVIDVFFAVILSANAPSL